MTGPDDGAVLVVLAAGQAKRYGGGLKPLAPVGPDGEAILDLVGSDAIDAGFTTIVVVLGPHSAEAIRDHVRANWPPSVDVRFAMQSSPRGTVDAVLSAWSQLGRRPRFGVSNADDLYGPRAFEILATHVKGSGADNALVGFTLERAVIGDAPVTRGVCRTGPGGHLVQIDERRGVTRRDDGTFATTDGRSPETLEPTTLVSMNLWAFSSSLEGAFRDAMAGAGNGEVLLPELVASLIATHDRPRPFAVLATDSRCVGVTHPDDLELVRRDIADQVERGERPAKPWTGA
ncbi:MAG: sugar phosphate nucleotidyltransferase [Acidimicrobiales bacterium]